jgi:hypothetical protein
MGIRSIIRAPADRFHLWQNLGQAVEKTVNATVLTSANGRRTARRDPAAGAAVPAEKKIVTRMRENYAAVQHLHAQGLPKTVIGRKLGLHPARPQIRHRPQRRRSDR